MIFDDRYQFILENFSKEIIANRYAAWLSEIQKIVNRLGGGDYFFINEESLSLAVLDYFTDIARLKEFQNIEHVNVQKIYSYSTFWILKRNPVQHIAAVPPELAYINEKTMLLMLLPKIMEEIGVDPSSTYIKNKSTIMNFSNLLFYNFCFRLFTPQTLELMIDAFFTGYLLGK